MKINFLKKRGAILLSAFFIMITITVFSQSTTTFNYSQSPQTFTVPTGVTSITVEAWGAGGGGGGGGNNKGFGGGGGGAYTRYTISPVASGTVYKINVGQGGLGTGNPGGPGGDSFFLSSSDVTLVSAQGGTGGYYDTRGFWGNSANGIPASGAIRNRGGSGGPGSNNGFGGYGGGGGGSGGGGGAGGNGTAVYGGNAGIAGVGTAGAAGGNGGTYNSGGTIINAVAGSIPGGGGGGNSNKITAPGGNGGNGRIVVSYLSPTNVNISVTKTVDNLSPFAGDVVIFSMVATNNFSPPVTANNVVLTDLLPNGYTFFTSNQPTYDKTTGTWNIGTMSPGATAKITITAIVNPTGVYTNIVTIGSTSQPNSNTTNNFATVTPTVCKASPTAPQVK